MSDALGTKNRRRFGRLTVVGLTSLAVAATVVVPQALSGSSAASTTMHMTQHDAARHPTHRTHGVAAVRHVTKPFRNLQRAENAGYEMLTDAKGIACIDMPNMGGMGVHFANGSLVGNPSEHIRHPEALVYRIDKTGMLRLAAVEYVVLVKAWHAKHPGTRPELFGHKFMHNKAGNRFGLPAFYSLHAWAWYHNPAGRFAPFNPRVTC
jgi:hypothetical protein